MTIKIKKGMDIKLQGSATEIVNTSIVSKKYIICPQDFYGISPHLTCKEGDTVERGSIIFRDKKIPEICFTSPIFGVVAAINRGEKRKITSIEIIADEADEAVKFDVNEQLTSLFSKAGIFPLITQRPYGVVANPNIKPRDIFVSFIDSSPLANNLNFSLKNEISYINIALNALTKLTSGKVFVSYSKSLTWIDQLSDNENIIKTEFSGKHPVGLVGTQINKLKPINKGEAVWTVAATNLPIIGKLLVKGEYLPDKIVPIAGTEVIEPQYYNLRIGGELPQIKADMLKQQNVRIISGSVLSGKNVTNEPYLRHNDQQICVIPEGNDYEMFGWLLPGYEKCSNSRTFLSMISPRKLFNINTNLHGEERAYVVTGQYEKVCPLDIYPQQLVKAIITNDIDKMENLGIYEVVEEDLALCEFVCTSKINVQEILRNGLDIIRSEME